MLIQKYHFFKRKTNAVPVKERNYESIPQQLQMLPGYSIQEPAAPGKTPGKGILPVGNAPGIA
jgi:hypothetical protein